MPVLYVTVLSNHSYVKKIFFIIYYIKHVDIYKNIFLLYIIKTIIKYFNKNIFKIIYFLKRKLVTKKFTFGKMHLRGH